MSKLICDVCGTSYSDTEHVCPNCGLTRAFEEVISDEERPQSAYKKIRGGRFSKKNVKKRLEDQARQPVKAAPVPAVEEPVVEESVIPVKSAAVEETVVPVEVPVEEEPTVDETVVPVEVPVEEEPTVEEAAVPEEIPVEEEPAVEETVIPVEVPVEEEPAVEETVVPEEVPVEEEPAAAETVIPAEVAAEEVPAAEETVVPAEVPAEEKPAETKKKKKGLVLNIVLGVSIAAFVLSAAYLLVFYGLPYLRSIEWPTQAVADTTEPSAQDSPNVPTGLPEPPRVSPTLPPTEPPTEKPTKPLLDVELELNYYDLTFNRPTEIVQLRAGEIPVEDITWISDNPGVVVVSDTGLITAVGSGETTVRAVYGHQECTVKIKVK